jgi:predicted ATP-binding protein involved in virulence
MNIKTLRVQNFKNFEDKTFEFSQGFNLIIGDNGTGKTALLEALSIALGGYLLKLTESKRRIQEKEVRFTNSLHGETNIRELHFPCLIGVNSNIFQEALYWHWFFLPIQQGVNESNNFNVTTTIKDLSFNVLQTVVQGKSVILPIISFYSTARLWLENTNRLDTKRKSQDSLQLGLFPEEVINPSSRLDGYKNALDVAISNKSWLRWFMRMELISLQNNKPMKVFEAVKKAVQTCLEGCDLLQFDIQLGEPVARIQGKPMPFSLLSDGQRSMLAMVADIAYRMAQLNPHLLENVTLETSGVVLIDELDLHLHPKWQRKVVDNLRKAFPKVQFFATTHSPFIIQSVRQGELIDLNEIKDAAQFQNQSIEDIVEKVQGVDLPQLSERKQQMFQAATEYYKVLEKAQVTDALELEQLKSKLDELLMPFSENMAYHAFLEMERLAALGEKA